MHNVTEHIITFFSRPYCFKGWLEGLFSPHPFKILLENIIKINSDREEIVNKGNKDYSS